jgi:hypothetical protein
MTDQTSLWHDCLEDALGATIHALGGVKVVAKMLWPVLFREKPDTASTRVRSCLNPEKADKFSPDEMLALIRAGADVCDHSIMLYIAREGRYEVAPMSPAEAKKRAKSARRKALLAELSRLEDEA